LCRSQEQHEFDLIRLVYHNTRLASAGRIAYSTLTYDEIKTTGCTPEDIDDQVSIPRSLSRIQIAMLFSEAERGVVRINFRGEGGKAVLPLAERLGGGGHTYSAGARIRGTMDAVVERVLVEADAHLTKT
jgi:bifunctional oligoribonuclease and PAP phosphatase NrnA